MNKFKLLLCITRKREVIMIFTPFLVFFTNNRSALRIKGKDRNYPSPRRSGYNNHRLGYTNDLRYTDICTIKNIIQ